MVYRIPINIICILLVEHLFIPSKNRDIYIETYQLFEIIKVYIEFVSEQ